MAIAERNILLHATKNNINTIQATPRFENLELAIASSATSLNTLNCIGIDVHGTLEFSDKADGTFIEVDSYFIGCAYMDEIFYKCSDACLITKHMGIEE